MSNESYLQKAISALRPATQRTVASRNASDRLVRTVVSFVPISTVDYKCNFARIEPGIFTLIDTHEYLARGEDPTELDRLDDAFFLSGGDDGKGGSLAVKTYESLPGAIYRNLNAIYGDWGLTEIQALRGVTDVEQLLAVQQAIFPDGPDAFPAEGRFRHRHEYLVALSKEFKEGTIEREATLDVVEAHRKGMDYRYRWAQRISAEAQEAQSKNGKSGRTFLETWEADIFVQLGQIPPGFMSVRTDGMPFPRTVKAEAATAGGTGADPALGEALTQIATSQQMMVEFLANSQMQMAEMMKQLAARDDAPRRKAPKEE
jgi:hypothetical protein